MNRIGERGIRVTVNCKNCGVQFQVHPYRAKTARFCQPSCSDIYRQNRVVWKCAICGKKRIHKKSEKALVCFSCDRQKKAKLFQEYREEAKAAQLETNKTNPLTGKFETNIAAKDWHLRSPEGVTYHFRNLRHFIRTHRNLFSDDQLAFTHRNYPVGSVCEAPTMIENRLSKLSPRRKHPQTTAQGWSWVLIQEG